MSDHEIMHEHAMRFNDGKLDWTLIQYEDLEEMVKVLTYGAEKYDRDNWLKGDTYNHLLSSLLRHTFALLRGEDRDKESGFAHTGHILCNAMFLEHARLLIENGRADLDDRRK